MTTNDNADKTEPVGEQPVEHTVTAIEAYWVETQLEYDPNSDWDPVTIVADETVEKVEGTTHAWEYECSCGEEFLGYGDARTHLIAVNE